MKSEKLQDAIGMVDGELVVRAENGAIKKPFFKQWRVLVAAVLALAIIAGAFVWNRHPLMLNAYAIALAEYPETKDGQREYYGRGESLGGFLGATVGEFLSGSDGENVVYSPLNVYMALAMLAEITDGESREEILSLLGSDSIELLRTQAHAIWNANYRDDGKVTSLLGSSVWLDKGTSYNQETIDILKNYYYASSFEGEMGSASYNKVLQSWLDDQTGGMLGKYASGEEFSAETVIALATTVCFQAKWENEFKSANNTEGIFHSSVGDLECEFMNKKIHTGVCYWGDKFLAVGQNLKKTGGGAMYFILPDEGVSIDELVKDAQVQQFITSQRRYENSKGVRINFSVPKFDVASKMDLKNGLQNLGVASCFDFDTSDFSPLFENGDEMNARIEKVSHAARVEIDEKGVKAAAYVEIPGAGNAAPPDEEIDFILDRPFVFVIVNGDGLPLFVGVVNQP